MYKLLVYVGFNYKTSQFAPSPFLTQHLHESIFPDTFLERPFDDGAEFAEEQVFVRSGRGPRPAHGGVLLACLCSLGVVCNQHKVKFYNLSSCMVQYPVSRIYSVADLGAISLTLLRDLKSDFSF